MSFKFDQPTKLIGQLGIAISVAVGLSACAPARQGAVEAAFTQSPFATSAGVSVTPDFATIKAKVFTPHCLKCHAAAEMRGDLNLEDYKPAFEAAMNLKDGIRKMVETDKMPKRGGPLAPDLKALLFAWIDAGAPEN